MTAPWFVAEADALPAAPESEFMVILPSAATVILVLPFVLMTNGCASVVPRKVDEVVPALPVNDQPVASGEFQAKFTALPVIPLTVKTWLAVGNVAGMERV
ncbi:MAG: hypothetical protein EBW14_17905 [Oxalobacteraceae bacterium]|nr:hypothetical protein [Oxalobacteraceae bacterium]